MRIVRKASLRQEAIVDEEGNNHSKEAEARGTI